MVGELSRLSCRVSAAHRSGRLRRTASRRRRIPVIRLCDCLELWCVLRMKHTMEVRKKRQHHLDIVADHPCIFCLVDDGYFHCHVYLFLGRTHKSMFYRLWSNVQNLVVAICIAQHVLCDTRNNLFLLNCFVQISRTLSACPHSKFNIPIRFLLL